MILKALKALGKTVVSGIIAFVILTLFCFLYYNIPVRSANRGGSTDYKWEANVFYSRGTDGFAWGKTNNDGFCNLFDYDDDMKIDILIMGSSHMEAVNVDMSQSTAGRLNALLENETVYNIGVSGHTFLTCTSNLKAALKEYQPTSYVVIETNRVVYSDEAITLAIRGETPEIPSYDGGIIGLLQKNPCLRLMYHQIRNFVKLPAEDIQDVENTEVLTESDIEVLPKLDTVNNEHLLDELLHGMSVQAEEYGVKLIIVYHPRISIASNGAINIIANQDSIAQFKKLCDADGILFLDMSNRFKEEYENTYILPYGFSNTSVGSGHLNKYGHAMMADELYDLISEDEQ